MLVTEQIKILEAYEAGKTIQAKTIKTNTVAMLKKKTPDQIHIFDFREVIYTVVVEPREFWILLDEKGLPAAYDMCREVLEEIAGSYQGYSRPEIIKVKEVL